MYFLSDWKEGTIIAIPKPNYNHKKTMNYKPITLLPVLGKNFERIIKLFTRIGWSQNSRLPIWVHRKDPLYSNYIKYTIGENNGKKSAAILLNINKAFEAT